MVNRFIGWERLFLLIMINWRIGVVCMVRWLIGINGVMIIRCGRRLCFINSIIFILRVFRDVWSGFGIRFWIWMMRVGCMVFMVGFFLGIYSYKLILLLRISILGFVVWGK